MYVCLLITREQKEQLSPNLQGSTRVPQGWFKTRKLWSRVGPGGQCANAIEAGVGADGSARIHMGTASGALGGRKARMELLM